MIGFSDGSEGSPVKPRLLRRLLYLTLAALFFVLGLLGVLLPGLPATPFFLLTSYFLVRSFPSLNERLLRSPMIGPLLRDWQDHRGIRPHVKVKAVGLIVVALGLSALFGGFDWPLLALVLGLGCVGIGVVLKLPTVPNTPQYLGTEGSTTCDQASMPPASETTSETPDLSSSAAADRLRMP